MRLWLCSASLLFSSHIALAAEPIVVRNSDTPLWDKTHRIEFTENLRIGGEEDDDEIFGNWVTIAADSKGRIIVGDRDQNQVTRYSADGEFLGDIGRGGEGPGEYRSLWTVATDSKDHIYVSGQGRFSVFDANGTFVREFTDESHGQVRDILILADKSVVLAEYDYPTQTALQKYVDGKHVAHFGDVHKFPQKTAMHLQGFLGGSAALGPDGMIYYSQLAPYEIRKFTPAGELLVQVFRENDFVSPPDVVLINDGARISGGCGSYGIFVLPDGTFIDVILGVDFTILDLFDKDGRLLLTQRTASFHPQWLDAGGNVYYFDRHASAVVRARMTIH